MTKPFALVMGLLFLNAGCGYSSLAERGLRPTAEVSGELNANALSEFQCSALVAPNNAGNPPHEPEVANSTATPTHRLLGIRFRQLTDEEVRLLLAGRSVEISDDAGFQFSRRLIEVFEEDGSYRAQTELSSTPGEYTIMDGNLCIILYNSDHQSCHSVYMGDNARYYRMYSHRDRCSLTPIDIY